MMRASVSDTGTSFPGSGQITECDQALGAAAGGGERVGLRRARHGPQRRSGDGSSYRPIPPCQRLVGSTRDDHPVGQRRRRRDLRFRARSPDRGPARRRAIDPRPLGEPVNTPSSPVKASRRALDGLTRGQDPCRGRCVSGVELDDRGIEQSPVSVHRGRRQGSRLLQSPSRSTQVAECWRWPGLTLRARWPGPRLGPTDAATRWVSRARPATSSAARACSSCRLVGLRSA